MPYVVIPVISLKNRKLKSTRVIDASQLSLTLHKDRCATFTDAAGDRVAVDVGGISAHDALDDALTTARDIMTGDHGQPRNPPPTEVGTAADQRRRERERDPATPRA